MEGRKLKDYKIRSGELNRTWNRFPAFWHLANGHSGHIEYHRNGEICKGEYELHFQWPLQSCLASWPFSLASWLPQQSFQTELRTLLLSLSNCFLRTSGVFVTHTPWMLTEACWRCPQKGACPPSGPSEIELLTSSVFLRDIAFLAWWLLPKAAG